MHFLRKLLAIVAATVVLVAGAALAIVAPVSAQVRSAADCATLYRFASEPVPVVKTADGAQVLASVEWGFSAELGLCYLVLDDTAVLILRTFASSIPEAPPPEDTSAASRCDSAYNPDRPFASKPVPVVKTADGARVLASVRWGFSAEWGLCYLVLDDHAVTTLRTVYDNAQDRPEDSPVEQPQEQPEDEPTQEQPEDEQPEENPLDQPEEPPNPEDLEGIE